jgi:hypothetical protein
MGMSVASPMPAAQDGLLPEQGVHYPELRGVLAAEPVQLTGD